MKDKTMTDMKKMTALLLFPLTATCMPASGELLAGWETWADAAGDISPATQTANGITATSDATPEAGGSWIRFSNATVANGGSSDGTYGSIASPAADTSVANLGDGYTMANGFDGFIDFTLTNTTDSPLDLTSFNFDSGAFRRNAARSWELSVLPGGAITEGSVESGGPVDFAAAPITGNYDIDLTGLADKQLEPAGTVTFRLNFTGGVDSSSGHHLFLDNVGIFGGPPVDVAGITDVQIAKTGAEVTLTFSSAGNVDIYRSTDLLTWGEVYASNEQSPYFDEVEGDGPYFYILVPTGQGLP